MKLTRKRVVIGATVAALALSGTGVAYAYWTTTGTGSGSASTSAGTANLAITQNAPALTAMFPGDTAQSFSAKVVNNGTSAAQVTNLGAYITTNQGAACDGSNFLINGVSTGTSAAPTPLGGWTSQELAQGGGFASSDGSDTVQFNNTGSNQDGCKGAVVTIHYVAS